MKETHIHLYDERDNLHTGLGGMKRFTITQVGSLEIESDLAYTLRIDFTKEDLLKIRNRLNKIEKGRRQKEKERKEKAEFKTIKVL